MAHDSNRFRKALYFPFIAFIMGMILAFFVITSSQKNSAQENPENTPLFSVNGDDVTLNQLPVATALQISEIDTEAYEKKLAYLQRAALERYIKQTAQSSQQPASIVRQQLFGDTTVNDEDVSRFFQQNEARIGRPFFEVKDDIGRFLSQQKEQAAADRVLSELVAQQTIHFHLPSPLDFRVEVETKGFPSKGPESAPVKIIEFADYQCPHCKDAASTIKMLMEKHPDKIHYTYMDFPINRSGISRMVAEGAVCADEQGKFWEYHYAAFEAQQDLNRESDRALANGVGVDMTQFNTCMQAPTTAEKVKQSEMLALSLGARGTPTIFINGIKYHGHDNQETLIQMVEDLL